MRLQTVFIALTPLAFTVSAQAAEYSPGASDTEIKIGNTMRTSVNVLEEKDGEAEIHVGLMMSTQMMPPQDQFQFEMFLSKAIPKMTVMKLNAEKSEMVLEGDAKIVLEATDTADV